MIPLEVGLVVGWPVVRAVTDPARVVGGAGVVSCTVGVVCCVVGGVSCVLGGV